MLWYIKWVMAQSLSIKPFQMKYLKMKCSFFSFWKWHIANLKQPSSTAKRNACKLWTYCGLILNYFHFHLFSLPYLCLWSRSEAFPDFPCILNAETEGHRFISSSWKVEWGWVKQKVEVEWGFIECFFLFSSFWGLWFPLMLFMMDMIWICLWIKSW